MLTASVNTSEHLLVPVALFLTLLIPVHTCQHRLNARQQSRGKYGLQTPVHYCWSPPCAMPPPTALVDLRYRGFQEPCKGLQQGPGQGVPRAPSNHSGTCR